jgi:hypothetical protein
MKATARTAFAATQNVALDDLRVSTIAKAFIKAAFIFVRKDAINYNLSPEPFSC